jgi:hypothetical protein
VGEFEFSYRTGGMDFLFSDGPLIEVAISAPVPLLSYLRENNLPAFGSVSGMAMIDTGASVSEVDEDVMNDLGIPFVKTILTETIHGTAETRCYNASASFPGIEVEDVSLNFVAGGSVRTSTLSGGDVIMLVGRDLLRRFTVTYDGTNSKVKIVT